MKRLLFIFLFLMGCQSVTAPDITVCYKPDLVTEKSYCFNLQGDDKNLPNLEDGYIFLSVDDYSRLKEYLNELKEEGLFE